MALKANIVKVKLNVANIDEHHYEDYSLTIAQHPSETDTRLVVRIAAFALFAAGNLEFTKGLSTDEEPEIWSHDDTGATQIWVDLGQPTDKRIKQACSKSEQVKVIGYNAAKYKRWFASLEKKTLELEKLEIYFLNCISDDKPENLIEKNMEVAATIQEGQLLLTSDQAQVTFEIATPLGEA